MAYVYGDYAAQATTPLIIARLRLHIAEVNQNVGGNPDVSSDGKSVAFGSAVQHLEFLQRQLAYYLGLPDATGSVNGGTSLVRFRRSR